MRSPFLLLGAGALAVCGWIGIARYAAEIRAEKDLFRAKERATVDALRWPQPSPRIWAGPSRMTDPTWRAFVARRRGSRIFAGWSPGGWPRVVAIDPSTGKRETAETVSGGPVRVSPDRKSLAFSQKHAFWVDFWVLTRDGTARRLADRPALPPAWGPDSRLLSFGGGRRVRIDASPLPDLPLHDGGIEDWSPDGRWLLVSANRIDPDNTWTTYGGNEQLSVVSVDGREERQLTFSGRNLFARFSPDSRQVVYTHVETRRPENGETPAPKFGASSLWIVGIDGKNARRVLPDPGPRVDMRACWSPNGRRLAVALNREADDRPRDARFVRRIHRIQIVDLNGQVWRTFDLPGSSWVSDLDWK
jgi:Tol biopolymer transport system component